MSMIVENTSLVRFYLMFCKSIKVLYISFSVWMMINSILAYFEEEHEERYRMPRRLFNGKKGKGESKMTDDRVHAVRHGGRSSDGYLKLSSGPAGEVSNSKGTIITCCLTLTLLPF